MVSQNDSILNLLGITDEHIQVSHVTEEVVWKRGVRYKQKVIHARLSYALVRCPNCGFPALIKNGTHNVNVRIPTLNGQYVVMRLAKQRYLCRQCQNTCGATSPLLMKNHTMAHSLKEMVVKLAHDNLSLTMIAKLTGTSASTVSRLLYKGRKTRSRVRHLPVNLCLDEFRSCHGQFAFIACDAVAHSLTTLLESRLIKDIRDYFLNRYSVQERAQVETVTIDMNANYQRVIPQLFPNAKIVIDRFHVIQLIGRALDERRIAVQNRIGDTHDRIYRLMKSQWKLLHCAEDDLDAEHVRYFRGINEYMTEQNAVDLMLRHDPVLAGVYRSYQDIHAALMGNNVPRLRRLLQSYRHLGCGMDTAIHTLRENQRYIENSCRLPFSNGPIEGINRKIKTLKRNCYGFKNLTHFFLRIEMITAC